MTLSLLLQCFVCLCIHPIAEYRQTWKFSCHLGVISHISFTIQDNQCLHMHASPIQGHLHNLGTHEEKNVRMVLESYMIYTLITDCAFRGVSLI